MHVDSLEKRKFLRPKDIPENTTMLHNSITIGAPACFTLILNNISDPMLIDLPDKNGETCLHVAAKNTNVKYLELLLKYDVNVNARDDDGNTALHVLVNDYKEEYSNKAKIRKKIQMLLKIPSMDAGVLKSLGDVIQDVGICTEKLLQDCNNEQSEISVENWRAKIINSMISHNSIRLQKELTEIQARKIPTYIKDYYIGSQDSLTYAVKYHSVEVIELLLKFDASQEHKTRLGKLPLNHAIARGSVEITSLLLKQMTDQSGKVDLTDESFSILQEALRAVGHASVYMDNSDDSMQCLERLLADDVIIDVNAKDESDPVDREKEKVVTTPLHIAASINSQEAMKLLIMNGAYLLEPRTSEDHTKGFALSLLECDTLCDAMDGCITAFPKKLSNDKESLQLDYRFLFPNKLQDEPGDGCLSLPSSVSLAHTALQITNEYGYKNFIKHPLMKTLLEIKWRAVKFSFYINLWISIAFHSVFLTFLFLLNINILMTQIQNNSTSTAEEELVLTTGWFNIVFTISDILLVPLLLYFLVREVIQLGTTGLRYFTNFENYLEVTVFILAVIISFVSLEFGTLKHLTAWGLILGW